MDRKRMGLPLALMGFASLCLFLAAAWSQPPELPVQSQDPLLESIKKRMGDLPRLDTEFNGDPTKPVAELNVLQPSSEGGKGSRKLRAAEWMLKSARYLEQHAASLPKEDAANQAEIEQLREVAKQLRKQVAEILSRN